MFMRNNRARNGAPQPEEVGREDAAAQRAAETLQPNGDDLGTPQQRTFQPNLETIEAITRRHVRGGLDEGEWPDYEDRVPVGPCLH